MTAITITNQIPTGCAFGVTDDRENVFIPAIIMASHGLQVGQRVEAILADNAPEMQVKTRWRVALVTTPTISGGYGKTHRAMLPEEHQADLPSPWTPEDLDDAIIDALADGNLWSIRDVAHYLLGEDYSTTEKPYYDISNALRRLHGEGHIAAAAVRPIASQGRPSFCLFAASVDSFR